MAVGHERAAECHRGLVAERYVFGHGVNGLLDGYGLAGQHCLFDFEILGFDESHIGGDSFAGFEQHNVAGHEIVACYGLASAVAKYGGARREHAANGLERFFGFAFLQETDDRIDDDDGKNNLGVNPVIEQCRHDSGAKQYINQYIVKLGEKPQQRPFALASRQSVGSELFESGACLGVRQAGQVAVLGGEGVRS